MSTIQATREVKVEGSHLRLPWNCETVFEKIKQKVWGMAHMVHLLEAQGPSSNPSTSKKVLMST
jgi:hypothetical protein